MGVLAILWTPFAGVDHLLTWILWIAVVVVGGVTLLSFVIWQFVNPDRLQTEEYRLEQQRITIFGDERHPGPVLIEGCTAHFQHSNRANQMNGKPTTYIINFFAEGVNLWTLTRYLHENREIIAYWNYIPIVFCVKTYLPSQELTERLQPYFPHPFMIAEINERNLNGRLPQEAWSWFYMDHHEKHELPSAIGGLAQLGGLGGLGGLAGLLPKK